MRDSPADAVRSNGKAGSPPLCVGRTRAVVRLAVAFTLITATAALVAVVLRARSASPDRALARLIATSGAFRPTEGRLSADQRYRRAKASSPAPADVRSLEAAGVLQQAADTAPTAENLHAWGIAQLVLGRYDAAVDTLQSALLQRPDDPALLADLGAALTTEASALDRPDALPRAAEVLEQALRRAPSLRAAWFTHAIVLERLSLPTQARHALQAYLRLDSATGWAREASERLAVLDAAATVRWPLIEKTLSGESLSDVVLDEAVSRYQLDVRETLVRTMLPAWARAPDVRTREAALLRIRRIAERLEQHSQDAYFRQVVDELDAAASVTARERMSTAILELAAALDGQRSEKARDEVEPRLATAASILSARHSTLLLWVQLSQARAASIRQAYEEVVALATVVARDAQRQSFPAIEARAHWLLGMTAFTGSRWADAAEHYERAIRLCERTRERSFAANVQVNAAVLSRALGNRVETWRHRLAAGAGFPPHGTLALHGYLTSGAATASSEGLPHAALLFQNEVVANGRRGLPPGPHTETFLIRARMLARLGRYDDATRDLDEAGRVLERIASEGVRSRMKRAWLLASAEVRLRSDPSRAADDAGRAIVEITSANEPIRLAEAALLESRALAASGHVDRARAAAERGITAFEFALRTIDARDPNRAAALEPVWDLYSTAARLELARGRDNYPAAFMAFERGRARTHLDLRRIEPLTLDGARQRLGEGEAVVLLDQSGDDLVAWWISRNRVDVAQIPLPAEELDRLVSEHGRSLDRGQRHDPASARLFDLAFGHGRDDLGKMHTVAVIADGAWSRVAWPALWDSSSGRELVATVSTVLSPSVAVALRDHEKPAAAIRSALVVSTPLADGRPALPGARREAREIVTIYPEWQLLEGADASPARVLEMAPSVDVLHVASHAVDVPSYPQLSHLLLGGDNRAARLFVRDVTARDLSRVRLVVLAACSTGGRAAVRGEGTVGMAWGFLIAGVPRVVATLRDIDDGAAERLFPAFHRQVAAGRTAAQSLRIVQRELAAAGEPPRVWATVAIYGAL